MNAKFTRTHTTKGDGNCFFRAISMYLTGEDKSHGLLRSMLIDYLLNNIDVFRRFTNKTEKIFFDYIDLMRNTIGINANDMKH